MRFLILGGSGFIGRSLSARITAMGGSVTLVSRTPIQQDQSNGNVCSIVADMSLDEEVARVFSDPYDYVVNALGYVDHSPFYAGGMEVIDVHFSSVLKQLKYIQRDALKKYIYIGSADEYGDRKIKSEETSREQPNSPYSFAKVAAGHLLQMLWHSEKFPVTIVRIFLTYGPEQGLNRFIPQVITDAANGLDIRTSPGEQVRDFCYIDDIVEGLTAIMESDNVSGHILNLASGQPVKVRDVVAIIAGHFDANVNFGARPYRPGEAMYQVADITKIKQLTAWKPKVSLEEGIEKTIKWYR